MLSTNSGDWKLKWHGIVWSIYYILSHGTSGRSKEPHIASMGPLLGCNLLCSRSTRVRIPTPILLRVWLRGLVCKLLGLDKCRSSIEALLHGTGSGWIWGGYFDLGRGCPGRLRKCLCIRCSGSILLFLFLACIFRRLWLGLGSRGLFLLGLVGLVPTFIV